MGRYVDETSPFDLPEIPDSDGRIDKFQGLYRKFDVTRRDGSSGAGGKHEHCEHFVLDVTHDKHAKAALTAYANACETEFPNLAADLRERYVL